jgi:hypothetical protein
LPWRKRFLSCAASNVPTNRPCIPCKASHRIESAGRKRYASTP